MKLYIDTNIYLSYVNPTSDFNSLEKLKRLIKEGKVELVLPSQTKEEFLRHFDERVLQIKEKIIKAETQFSIPNELKSKKKKKYTKEENDIIKKIDNLNDDLKKYRILKIAEFTKHLELVKKLLKEIFQLAIFFEYTDEVVLKAVVRFAKGLPPKKNDDKFGDAIIWETLKENIKREDIVIISVDNDFVEIKNKKKRYVLNVALLKEWKKYSGKKATLFPVLGQFINTIDTKDPISFETIQKEVNQVGSSFYKNNICEGATSEIMSGYSTAYLGTSLGSVSSAKLGFDPVIGIRGAYGMSAASMPMAHLTGMSVASLPIAQSGVVNAVPTFSYNINEGENRSINSLKICKKCGGVYVALQDIGNLCNTCIGKG